MQIREGDTVQFTPKNGGEFPTGETTRLAVVEKLKNDEVIIRQLRDDFTDRVSYDRVQQPNC